MIKPEQVPKESLVAYQRAFKAGGGPSDAIAAALNAWPGAEVHYFDGWTHAEGYVLPLTTQENEQ